MARLYFSHYNRRVQGGSAEAFGSLGGRCTVFISLEACNLLCVQVSVL